MFTKLPRGIVVQQSVCVCERLCEHLGKYATARSARLNIHPVSMFGFMVSQPSHTSGPSSQQCYYLSCKSFESKDAEELRDWLR